MTTTRGVIGPGRYGDMEKAYARSIDSAALVASLGNGRFYEQTIRGNMYLCSTAAAGIVLAAPANTNQFCIWNMQDNKVLAIPVKIVVGVYSGAAAIAGSVSLYIHTGMSSAIGTAAPFSVWTNITPVPTYIGGQSAGIGASAACKFSTTNTCTATFAATFHEATAWSQLQSRAGGADPPFCFSQDITGAVLYPGSCLRVNSSSAMAWTATISVYMVEVQLPLWAT
jgi:hypothetical protein